MTDKKTFNANICATTAKRRTGALPLLKAIVVASAITITVAPASVSARDLLFLGVTDIRGEPAQPELEAGLRAEFAADRRFRLTGGLETERIAREMERLGRTRAETAIPRNAGLADSTVIIRGVVKELSVVTGRSWLLWGKIEAKMRLEVSFSELSGSSAHRGEFSAEASKRKDFILLRSSKKVVHVSATDREELLGQVRDELIKDAADLAATYFNALSAGSAQSGAPKDSTGADTASAPAGTEYSTVDGKDVAPIDSAVAADKGK
jgi:hypothetical protein